jgi:hypothetical protein
MCGLFRAVTGLVSLGCSGSYKLVFDIGGLHASYSPRQYTSKRLLPVVPETISEIDRHFNQDGELALDNFNKISFIQVPMKRYGDRVFRSNELWGGLFARSFSSHLSNYVVERKRDMSGIRSSTRGKDRAG